MSIVTTLKNEHKVMRELFEEVKTLGITSEAGVAKLRQSKSLLLAHLRKEDEQLYPALKKLEDGKKIARAFQKEMSEISRKVLSFYTKYEAGVGSDNMAFSRDFGSLLGAMNNRMIKEEATLYAVYQIHYA